MDDPSERLRRAPPAHLAVAALRLLTELAALVALAVGAAGPLSGPAAVVGALLAPLAGAAVWGRWMAPRARRRLRDPGRLVAEVAYFLVAGSALAAAGWPVAGVALAVVAVGAALGLRRTDLD